MALPIPFSSPPVAGRRRGAVPIVNAWCFNDPEMKRRRRVAGYKAYGVKGKVKASLRRGLRWFKSKCSGISHLSWSYIASTLHVLAYIGNEDANKMKISAEICQEVWTEQRYDDQTLVVDFDVETDTVISGHIVAASKSWHISDDEAEGQVRSSVIV
ncbi:hypothetical protein ACQ4PT_010480 [Festuca glaucescens]